MNNQIFLGHDPLGEKLVKPLFEVGNILIGGSTGSGKSFFIHHLIDQLIAQNTPSEILFLLADPKKVEFKQKYQNSPYLFCDVLETPEDIFLGLEKVLEEKKERLKSAKLEPTLFVVIDTFSDLMECGSQKFETMIEEIANESSKTNIFILLSDSRIGEKVFSEKIRSCFQTKIAFQVSSFEGSQFLLDHSGAEELKNPGEMMVLFEKTGELVKVLPTFSSPPKS